MVFVSGPRQAGKTTLAASIAALVPGAQMFNWDVVQDRRVLLARSWVSTAPLLMFDELHKMKGWRQRHKGGIDGRTPGQSILDGREIDFVVYANTVAPSSSNPLPSGWPGRDGGLHLSPP